MHLAKDMPILGSDNDASPASAPPAHLGPGSPDCHLFSHLAARVQHDHDKCAITCHGRCVSYGELHGAALCLAGYLQQHLEVRRGDRVLLAMHDWPRFAIAWYAVLRCDAVVVAVNPACARAVMARDASETGARVAIAAHECQSAITRLLDEGQLKSCIIAACPAPNGLPGDAPGPQAFASLGKPRGNARPAGMHDFSDALAAGIGPVAMVAGAADPAVIADVQDDTGQPRSATLSHRGFALLADRTPARDGATASPLGMAEMILLSQAVARADTIKLPPATCQPTPPHRNRDQ
jgi:fatty-acyl-CoA synthase